MKKLVLLFVVLGLVSCKKEDKGIVKPQNNLKTEKIWVSKNQKFLDKFKTVNFDTLNVYSTQTIDKNYRFKGDSLNEKEVLPVLYFLSHEVIEGFDNADFHAVNQFDLDDENLGLIARTMGEYWASSIKIYGYSKKEDKIKDFLELGENSGDAGDSFDKKSWIFKDKDNAYKFFIWTHFEHDNSVEEEPKTPNFKEDKYYLVKFSNGKFDTISKNNNYLEKQFSKIIKKENHK